MWTNHQYKRSNGILTFNCWTDCFKYSFIPSTLNNRFNFTLFDPIGLKFLTRLRLGFNHLDKNRSDLIWAQAWIPYVLVVWRSKILHIPFCTATTFHTIMLSLKIVQNQFVITLSQCLTMPKRIYFYSVTHDLMKTIYLFYLFILYFNVYISYLQ